MLEYSVLQNIEKKIEDRDLFCPFSQCNSAETYQDSLMKML